MTLRVSGSWSVCARPLDLVSVSLFLQDDAFMGADKARVPVGEAAGSVGSWQGHLKEVWVGEHFLYTRGLTVGFCHLPGSPEHLSPPGGVWPTRGPHRAFSGLALGPAGSLCGTPGGVRPTTPGRALCSSPGNPRPLGTCCSPASLHSGLRPLGLPPAGH